MTDRRSRLLPFVARDEEERRFHVMLGAIPSIEACGDVPPQAVSMIIGEIGRLVTLVEQLKHKVETLEAELVPLHRSRKCPYCFRLSLAVVAARPHPELGYEGIEQHDVQCSCGYQASRLYDPRDFLC
jgi:hypothetical protein